MQSTGHVPTERAGRYGKQLVAHLGRRHGGEYSEDEGHGTITLGAGQADLTATPEALVIRAEDSDLDQLEDVVERHLVRFGEREELAVAWTRAEA